MLSDTRGVYGGLGKGHERDENGLSYDALFKRDKRQDSLWDSSELNVRSELGLVNYDQKNKMQGSEADRMRRSLDNHPQDLSYSSYHRHSELGTLLKKSEPVPRWDPLEGIDRYWHERKAESRETGDFEDRRVRNMDVPKEGAVRIVVPDMHSGHETLGLFMTGLTVVGIVDPNAYTLGWRVGDEVQKVNRIPVLDGAQFKEAISRAVSRNHLTASPLLFDIWREPLRSAHHGPQPGMVPFGMPPQQGMMGPPWSMASGPPMMSGPPTMSQSMMPQPPMPQNIMPGPGLMSPPGAGYQQRLAALSQENAMLRQRLGM